MNYLSAAILGVVEGLTEFLPVSSTAHLEITSSLLGLAPTDFVKTFEIAIQAGAILAVVVLYFRKFLDFALLKKLFVAFLPTGVLGLIFYKLIKTYLLGSTSVIMWSLGLGGLALIVFEYWYAEKKSAITDVSRISYGQCLALGLFQALAMVPGVSRSGATIVGGLLLGLSRPTIVEFSFLLAVPTMLAATGFDLLKNASAFSGADFGLLAVGFLVAFLVALAAIRFFLSFIRRHSFVPFGIYRIIVAVVLFWLL